jgi:hypothetical protein
MMLAFSLKQRLQIIMSYLRMRPCLAVADSAGSTVFSVLAWVSSPEKVGHICGNYNTQYYYIKIQFIYFKNHFGMISNVLNNLSFISNLKIFF